MDVLRLNRSLQSVERISFFGWYFDIPRPQISLAVLSYRLDAYLDGHPGQGFAIVRSLPAIFVRLIQAGLAAGSTQNGDGPSRSSHKRGITLFDLLRSMSASGDCDIDGSNGAGIDTHDRRSDRQIAMKILFKGRGVTSGGGDRQFFFESTQVPRRLRGIGMQFRTVENAVRLDLGQQRENSDARSGTVSRQSGTCHNIIVQNIAAHETSDENDVGAIQNREIDRLFRRLAQVLQEGHRTFYQTAGARVVEAKVEHLHAQLKPLGVVVLNQITQLCERMRKPLCRRNIKPRLFGDLRKAQCRPAAVEGLQHTKSLFHRLDEQRVSLIASAFDP